MYNYVLSLLINHILKELEAEFLKEEPEMVKIAVQEVELFISKLENLLASKSSKIAQYINPALVDIGAAAVAGVEAIGNSLEKNVQEQ